MKIGRIYNYINNIVKSRKLDKAEAIINKHVQMPNLWEVPESVCPLISEVTKSHLRERLAILGKENGIKFSLSVREEAQSSIPKLDISLSKLPKGKKDISIQKPIVRTLDIDDSQILVYTKKNPRLLRNKDEEDYQFIGAISTDDDFLKRVYRTVDFLMYDLNKSKH